VPKRLIKLAKQHDPDAKFSVSTVEHPHVDEGITIPSEFGVPNSTTDLPTLEITPKMRESILAQMFA
jgi:predicted glycosyltransferase